MPTRTVKLDVDGPQRNIGQVIDSNLGEVLSVQSTASIGPSD